jgi:hypothetical protein
VAEAIVLFGSASRGDDDRASDIDILILADTADRIRTLSAQYKGSGANVSSYTWKRFGRLVVSGSLFVHHLRLEGRIISDDSRQLTQLLDTFRLRESYQDTVESSIQIVELARSIAPTSRSRGWAFDGLMIGFRGVLIPRLVAEGRSIFSFGQLVDFVTERDNLPARHAHLLQQLRIEKARYRQRNYDAVSQIDVLQETAALINQCCKVSCIPSVCSRETILRLVLSHLASSGNAGYINLRMIDLGLSALQGLDWWEESSSFLALQEMVSNPAGYSFTASRSDSQLIRNAQSLFQEALSTVLPDAVAVSRLAATT